jgi:hypothetical protein
MVRKKSNEREILEQESLRFEDEDLRKRLNDVLANVRDRSEGVILKAHFFKALIGLQGYELRTLTQEHREYLSGARNSLPEGNEKPRTRVILDSGKRVR